MAVVARNSFRVVVVALKTHCGRDEMDQRELDLWHMQRALALAANGRGGVEPNPMVGCVVAHGAEIVGEGWHRRFGGPHAEVEALGVAGPRARGATLYVTLEPCCHEGKTPPCTRAILAAGIRRVVAAQRDPFPAVNGGGVAELENAGIEVEVGLGEDRARWLNAPYLKLLGTLMPWVIAKWAMTLDGKIATRTRDSRWISGTESRRIAHELRGRVDGIVVGRGTVEADDPLLTTRPEGQRKATRIVLDSSAVIADTSQLIRTAHEAPLVVVVDSRADLAQRRRLESRGCEVLTCDGPTHAARWLQLLVELGRRKYTNVLVEGGSRLLGSLLDEGQIDEVHVFVAPLLVGGAAAPTPMAGTGVAQISQALRLADVEWQACDGDLYCHARCRPPPRTA